MHKKIIVSLMLAMSTFLMSGCIKYSTNIEIDSSNKIHLSQVSAFNTDVFNSPEASSGIESMFERNKDKYEEKGFRAEKYNSNKYKGIKISKDFRIEDFKNSDLPQGFSSMEERPVRLKKSFFVNKVAFDMKFENNRDIPQIESYINSKVENDTQAQNEAQEAAKDLINNSDNKAIVDLTVKIPQKAKVREQNATAKSKKNVFVWDLSADSPVLISMKYDVINYANIFLTIIVLLLISGIIYIQVKNKEHEENTKPSDSAY